MPSVIRMQRYLSPTDLDHYSRCLYSTTLFFSLLVLFHAGENLTRVSSL
ncbi:MAG: hypothetical protein IPM55_19790 [Acidobacteria bacterium]|nr:hypothetical protein [Acidobacteriota bacterium]